MILILILILMHIRFMRNCARLAGKRLTQAAAKEMVLEKYEKVKKGEWRCCWRKNGELLISILTHYESRASFGNKNV